MTREETPDRCPACGAERSIHGGHGRQISRNGLYSYACGRHWRREGGWGYPTPRCDAQRLEAANTSLRKNARRLRAEGRRARAQISELNEFLHEIHQALAAAGYPTVDGIPGPDGTDGISHTDCVKDLARERDELKARLEAMAPKLAEDPEGTGS